MVENASLERVRELISYDPVTGVFTRAKSVPGRYGRVGSRCGTVDRYGYLLLCIDHRKYSAGRVAWLLHYGSWPQWHVDHIDGNKLNNSIENLRDVPNAINAQNKRSATKKNQTGFLGVVKSKNRFLATVRANGKNLVVGRFDTPDAAHAAYVNAKRHLHAGCTL